MTAKAQCSGRWPGVWIVDEDVTELDLRAVGQSVVRKRCTRSGVDPHRHAVLEREPPVSRDVIGMGMRLEHAGELNVVASARIQVGLDRIGRIDDDGDACMLVTDDVGSATEVVVDELLEYHVCDASNRCGYIS